MPGILTIPYTASAHHDKCNIRCDTQLGATIPFRRWCCCNICCTVLARAQGRIRINSQYTRMLETMLETLYKLFYRTETRRSTLGLDKNLPYVLTAIPSRTAGLLL